MTGAEEHDAGPLAGAGRLTWCVQDRSLGPAEDLDYAVTLLRAVQEGALPGPLVRVYRPEPTVSFGQRDVRLPDFGRAQQISRSHGFAPVVRRAGGRAAAYHRGSLVVDHLQAEPDAAFGSRARFQAFAGLYTQVLRTAGVDAAVGEIPGEYCPGEFSVHAWRAGAGPVKVIGTAQRAVAGAWLFSSSWVIQDPCPVRQVLEGVYEALGLDWDPRTAGAADQAILPGAGVETATVESVGSALRDALAPAQVVSFDDLLDQVPAPPTVD